MKDRVFSFQGLDFKTELRLALLLIIPGLCTMLGVLFGGSLLFPNIHFLKSVAFASIMRKEGGGEIVRDYDPRTSNYEVWQHQQEAGLYTRDANISEAINENTSTRSPWSIRERNPQILTDNPNPTHMSDVSGTYVDRVDSRYETGQQIHMTNGSDLLSRGKATAGNALPSPLEWAIDAYNIVMNAILEIPIEEYKESLKEELKAKEGITVIEHKI